jgi:hypothetical protein
MSVTHKSPNKRTMDDTITLLSIDKPQDRGYMIMLYELAKPKITRY